MQTFCRVPFSMSMRPVRRVDHKNLRALSQHRQHLSARNVDVGARGLREQKEWLGHARLTDVLGLVLGPLALERGSTAVDATCGNGHDTLTLARLVGPEGRLVAFDTAQAAVDGTRKRLHDELGSQGLLPRLDLIHDSHARMLEHVAPSTVQLVCFNLGCGSFKEVGRCRFYPGLALIARDRICILLCI